MAESIFLSIAPLRLDSWIRSLPHSGHASIAILLCQMAIGESARALLLGTLELRFNDHVVALGVSALRAGRKSSPFVYADDIQ